MASKKVDVVVSQSGQAVSQAPLALDVKAPRRLKAVPGVKYILREEGGGVAPENITLRRQGENLLVLLEGDTHPVLIIENYFSSAESGGLYGMAEDGQLYPFVPTDATEGATLLRDGASMPMALGGDPVGPGDALKLQASAVTDDDGANAFLGPLLFFAGVGTMFGVAVATSSNGNGGGSTSGGDSGDHTSSQPSGMSVIDNNGPIRGELSNGAHTDDRQPVINGSGTPGYLVTISDNGVPIGTTTVNPDGTWTFQPSVPLAEGAHKIEVTQQGPGMSPSAPVLVADLIVDCTPPAPPGVLIDGNASTTTNNQNPTFSGTGEPGDTIRVVFPDGEARTTTVNPDGTWAVTPPDSALPDGEHDVRVIAEDQAGNTTEVTVPVTIDTVPPLVQLGTVTDDVAPAAGTIPNGGSTNDTTPTLSGTAEPGTRITVVDNGVTIGTTVADATGAWSFTPDKPLAEGEHALTVTGTDAAGNASTVAAFDLTVDTVAPPRPAAGVGLSDIVDDVGPIRGVIVADASTDDARPTFGGYGTPGNTMTVYDHDVAIGRITIASNGRWTLTPNADLAEGLHSITVAESDAAGNESLPTEPLSFTLDVTPPDAARLALTGVTDDVGPVTGNVTSGSSSDDSRPSIAGTGTAGDTIIVFTDDSTGRHEIGRTTVNAQGTWVLEPALPLIAGSNAFTVVEQDPVGNQTSPTAPYMFMLETSRPLVPTIVNIADDVGDRTGMLQMAEQTDDNQPTILGTARPGSTITIFDGTATLGTTTTDANGNWTFTPSTPLANGPHSVTATASSDGVTSVPTGARTFVVDTSVPAGVTNLVVRDDEGAQRGILTDGGTTDDSRPAFAGLAEPGGTVVLFDNGVRIGEAIADASGNWAFTPAVAWADGEHALTTMVADATGAASPASEPFNLIVDTSAVRVQITAIHDDVGIATGTVAPGDATDDTRPEIRGTGRAGSTISVLDGTTTLGTTTVDGTGHWTFTPPGELGQGQHSLTAVARDTSGNVSPPTPVFVFRIDTTAPATPPMPTVTDDVGPLRGPLVSGGISDDTQPTLGGLAGAGGTVHVYDNGQLIGVTTVDASGKWGFTPPTPLPEGAHAFEITITDTAGNASGKSPPFALTIDVTPPDAAQLALTGVSDDIGEVTGNLASGATTDDDRPLLSGTGTAGNRVIVATTDSSGSHVVGQATVSVGGLWTLQLSAPLLTGSNALTVLEVDPAGNETEPTAPYTIVVDTSVPPAPLILGVRDDFGTKTGALQPGEVTDDNTPTFSGTAQPGTTVRLYDNTVLLGTTLADATGAWEFTPTAAFAALSAIAFADDVGLLAGAMPDGLHSIAATATTSIGQTSELGTHWAITIDTTAPATVTDLVVRDNEGGQTGPLANGAITDDSRPTFSGTAESGTTVSVFDNGALLGETKAGANGAWSFEPAEALTDGEHAFTVTVTDVAGNSSAPSQPLNVTLDTAVVPLQITSISDDAGVVTGDIVPAGVTDDTRPEVQGVAKAGSTITVFDGATSLGTAVADGAGHWTFTPTADLGQGVHNISATARDTTGNTSPPTPVFSFRIDTVAPQSTTILGVTDDVGVSKGAIGDGGITDDAQPVLAGRAEAGSTVSIHDNDVIIGTTIASANGSWSFMPTTPLLDGAHSFEATATDDAGNISGRSSPFSITLDTVAPDPANLAITGVVDDVGGVTGNVAAGATTDDNRPAISGTGTAGNTIIVSVTDSTGTRELGRVTVSDDGSWVLTPVGALVSGGNAIVAVEMDRAGNQTPATPPYAFIVDTSRPDVPLISNVQDDVGTLTGLLQKGGVTDDNLPTILGTGHAGDTIRLYDGVTQFGSTTVDASGNWSFTPSTALGEGLHNVTATATSVVGQTSDPTAIWAFTVDTLAPAAVANLLVQDDQGAQQGPLASGATTDDSRPTLTGRAEAGSTVTVSDNGLTIGQATVDANGNWTFAPASALDDGHHALTLVVTDVAGNSGPASAPFNLIVNTEAVVVQITALKDDVGSVLGDITAQGVTDDTRPEVQGIGKVGSTITIFDGATVLGTTTVDGTGQWTFMPLTQLLEGQHSITATARDAAGNTSAPTPPFAFRIDTTVPAAATIDSIDDDVGGVAGRIPDGGSTDDAQPTLSGRAEAGSTVTLYDNQAFMGTVTADAGGNWAFTPTSPLPEGAHVFEVEATDAAGNTGPRSNPASIEVDVTAPDDSGLAITGVADDVGAVTGDVAAGGTTDDSRPTIRGTGTAGDTIIVSTTDSNGLHEIGRVTVGPAGTWTLDPAQPLLPGSNALTVVEMDAAGNQTPPSAPFEFVVDSAKPLMPAIVNVQDDAGVKVGFLQKGDSTDDALPTIIGTAQAASVINVYDGASLLGSTTADASGNWSFTPATPLADGAHGISVTATNSVGQTSEPTGRWNFSVDTTAPAPATNQRVVDGTGTSQGPLANGAVTDDSRPAFSGRAEAGSTVEILDGGVKIGEARVDSGGNWNWSPTDALVDGAHVFNSIVRDAAGNASTPSPALSITVDTSALAVQITALKDDVGGTTGSIAPNDFTDDRRPEIQGTGKSGSTITVFDGNTTLGTTTVDGTGRWTFTPASELGQGQHSIAATARDLAGNVSPRTEGFVFRIDTTAPAAPAILSVSDDVAVVQGNVPAGGTTDDTQPTLSGRAEAGSTVSLYDNGALIGTGTTDASGNWRFTPTTPLAEGDHAFTVDATDAAGNTSPKSPAFTVTVDVTGPDATKLAITGVIDDVGTVTGNVAAGATTDDSRPLIQGTGTAGDTIIVSVTDGTGTRELGRVTVSAGGTWSLEPVQPLFSGSNAITVVEMDAAGNQTPPTSPYSFELDTTRPSSPVIVNVQDDVGVKTGFLQKGDVTDDTRPTILGTAGAGNTINIYHGALLLGTTTADESGDWTFTPSTAMTSGPHSITVTATNAVGQTSEPTGVWNFTIDTTAPAPVTNLVIQDATGATQGPLANGAITDDSHPGFSGRAEPGSTVEILDHGVKIGEAPVDAGGNWSFSPGEALPDGGHALTVVVRDAAGNASPASPAVNITVNTEAVVVQIVAVADDVGSVTGNIAINGVTDDTRPQVQGTGKSGSTITVSDGSTALGTTIVDANGQWAFTPTNELGQGQHSLTARARDLAGNVSDPTEAFVFRIDTTAPAAATIASISDDVGAQQGVIAAGGVTDDTQPTLTGRAEAGSTVGIYDNGALIGTETADAAGNWSFTPTTGLDEGPHSFEVAATDAAGNTGARSAARALTIDVTVPDASRLAITALIDDVGTITGTVSPGATTDDSSPLIQGTGTAGDTIVASVTDGNGTREIGQAIVGAGGTWSLTPTQPLSAGANAISVVEVDAAGNRTPGSASYNFVIDLTRPALPVIVNVEDDVGVKTGFLQKGGVTDDNLPVIIGTAQAGDTIDVYDGGTRLGLAVTDANGDWTFTPPTALANGLHNITVTATNAVGQTSDPTGIWNFTIDTTVPTTVSNVVVADDVGAVQGPIANGAITDDSRPSFTGRAEPGATVEILDNGVIIGEATVDGGGNWTFLPADILTDGPHALAAVVRDAAGNASPISPALNITVNTETVAVQIGTLDDNVGSVTGSITPNGVTDDTRPEIRGTGKSGSTITVFDGSNALGTAVVDGTGQWRFTPSNELGQGQHSVTATARDLTGNVSAPTPAFVFRIDTSAPVVPTISGMFDDVGAIQGAMPAGAVTDDAQPTLTGTAEAGSTVTVYDNNLRLGAVTADASGNWSFTPTTALTDGLHAIQVTATDIAGNASARSGSFSFTVDVSAPDPSRLAITAVVDDVGAVTGNVAAGATTDDTRPVIQGTGTAGDTIILSVVDAGGTHEVGRTTVTGGGTWSLEAPQPLLLGNNSFTAVEMDPAGNQTTPSAAYAIVVDAARPRAIIIENVQDDVGSIIGMLQKDGVTDDNRPTILGSAGAGGTIRVFDGETLLGTTTGDGSGKWTFTPATPLSDGVHGISATATNAVGQTSDPTGEWRFTVDTTAPGPVSNLTVMDNTGDVQGPLDSGATTDESRPEFSGQGEPGSRIDVFDNGVKIGETVVDGDGAWTFAPVTPLADGQHAVTVIVTDSAGNSSAPSAPVNLIVNTEALLVRIDAIRDDVGSTQGNVVPGGVTDDTRPEIQGSGISGSTITVRDGAIVLGTTTVDGTGRWRLTPATPLAQGEHAIAVTARDAAGNVSEPSASFPFIVDSQAPGQPIIGSVEDDVGTTQGTVGQGGVTEDPQPTIGGTAEPGGVVTVYDNGKAIGTTIADASGNWSLTPTTPLAEGQHVFEATVTDAAGNTGAKSASYAIGTDYSAPDAAQLAITGVLDDVGVVTGNVTSGATTDDSIPVIQGTGTAGDTIIVTVEDATGKHELGRATVGAGGTWTLTPAAPLTSGSNVLTAIEVDPAGNQAGPTPAYTVILDVTQPAVPVIENVRDDVGIHTGMLQKGDVTDHPRPVILGTAEAGSTINVFDGATFLGSTAVDASGNWTFIPPTALADGPHNITVTAVNTVGQTSQPTGIWNFTVDTAPPGAVTNLVVLDDEGSQKGPLTNGATTDDNRPSFSGRAEAGSTVQVSDKGVLLDTVTVDAQGNWTFTPDAALADGAHAFTTVVTDVAGNSSAASPAFNIVVDTSAVLVQLTVAKDDIGSIRNNIAAGDDTDDTQPELQGTGKAGSTVTVYDNGSAVGTTVVNAAGQWIFIVPALGNGEHSLTVTATDLAGNTTEPTAPLTFRVDTTAPDAPVITTVSDDVGTIMGPLVDSARTDDAQPTLAGSSEAGSKITVRDNGQTIGTVIADSVGQWSFTPTTPLAEGQHSLDAMATDAAGNVSQTSAPFTLTVDVTPPNVTQLAITTVVDDVASVLGPVIRGATTDDNRPLIQGTGTAGDTVIVSTTDSTGTREIGRVVVAANGSWALEPAEPLTEGNNAFVAVERDAAGNETTPSASYAIVVDTSRPPIPVLVNVVDDVGTLTGMLQKGQFTDDARPTMVGTAQAGATIRLYHGELLLGSTLADASGNWTFTPATALGEGVHNITVTATNPVGQTSDATPAWNFSVDTIAPAPSSNGVVIDDEGAQKGPLANGAITDDSRLHASGRAEANATVEFYDSGVKRGETQVDANGNWAYESADALVDGTHVFTAVVRDAAHNRSAPSQALTITVDTTAIDVRITSIVDDVGQITGSFTPGTFTDDTRPEIRGTSKSGSTITVFDGGTSLGTTTANGSGEWSFTPAGDLGQGQHIITATARDLAGNVSEPTAPFAFRIDTIAPTNTSIRGADDDVGSVTGPLASGAITDDPQPTLRGAAEAGSTVNIYDSNTLIGTVVADASGNWSFTPTTALTEGQHVFEAAATDAAGNTSIRSSSFTINVDITPPNASTLAITGMTDDVGAVTGNIPKGATTDDSRPVIQGTGTSGNTVIVYALDSTGKHEIGRTTVLGGGTWSLEPAQPLISGDNTLTAVEMDTAGNQTAPSAPYAIVLDTAKPSVPVIVNVQDDVGIHAGMLQKGDITDDTRPAIIGTSQAGNTIRVYDGATALGTATADASGNWSFVPSTPLADGPHNITVTATNIVGQTSAPTGNWNFVVDATPPTPLANVHVFDDEGAQTGTIVNNSTMDDSRPTFSGIAEPGTTVEVFDNGLKIGEAAVDSGGNWSFSPAVPLADGAHAFTGLVRDVAGNASPSTQALRVTLDTSAVLVQISAVDDDIGTVKGAIAPGTSTDDTRPTFLGTGKNGSTVTVFDGGTALGTTTVDGTGHWSFTPSADLGQGSHTITATARDLAGNVSAPTPAFTFSIDTSAPLASTITSVTDDVGAIKGAVPSGGLTDDPLPTLAGTAEARSTVTIYDNGKVLGTEQADAAGNWLFTPTTALPAGQHVFEVTASDAAGNTSPKSNTFTIGTDYTVPDVARLAITGVIDDVGAVRGNIAKGATSDDSSPVIQGTGTAGNTIIVSVTDTTGTREIGRALVAAGGTWSLEPSTPLKAGSNKIVALEMTPAGSQGAPTPVYEIILDFTAPSAPVIENVQDDVGGITGMLQKGGVTDDVLPTIIGTAQAGSTIEVLDNGTTLGWVTAAANGRWTFTPTSGLADGAHGITATATNTVGQTSVPTGIWNFTIDATMPAAITNLIVQDDVGARQGPLANGDTTDDSRPAFSGRAEPASIVSIYDNGVKIGETSADASGNWSFTPAAALADGNHAFTMSATDRAGNVGVASPAFTVTLDTSAVAAQIVVVKDDAGATKGDIAPSDTTDDTRPEFQGSGKNGSTITVLDGVTVLGTTTVDGTGHWTFTPPADLGQGQHSITVTARDLAGNVSTPTPAFAFRVDTVPPSAPTITSAVDDVGKKQGTVISGGITDDPQPTLAGSSEAGSTVTLLDNGKIIGTTAADASGNWSFTPTTALAEGAHAFEATATDTAGNVSGRSAPFTMNMDYTPPSASQLAITGVMDDVGTVTGNIARGGTTDDNRPLVQGTGTAGNSVILTVFGNAGTVELGTVTVAANGTWSLQVGQALASGSNKFTAVEMDAAGNQTSPTIPYEIILDSAKPPAPAITGVSDDVGVITGAIAAGAVTDDSRPTITGTSVAGYTIGVYDGATLLGATTVAANGTWSFTPSTVLADGVHSFTAAATSPIGTTSDASAARSLTIDTAAPDTGRLSITNVTDDVGAVTGNVARGGATDDTRPTLQGTGTAGDTIIVSTSDLLGTREIGRATVVANGTWSMTPSQDLNAGTNAFAAVEMDMAGNQTVPSQSYGVVVSTTKPPIAINDVQDDVGRYVGTVQKGGATDDTRPVISGTTQAGSTVSVFNGSTLLGTTTANASGVWAFAIATALAQGSYSLSAIAVNPLGQSSDRAAVWDITIDTTPPALTTVTTVDLADGSDWGQSNNDNITGYATPLIQGKATSPIETLSKLSLTLFNDSNQNGTFDASETVFEAGVPVAADGTWATHLPSQRSGTYYVKAVLVDEAGNAQVTAAGSLMSSTGSTNAPLVIEPGGRMTYAGATAGDGLGWEMVDVGDFNGDGFSDVVVSALSADGNTADAGRVYILFGSATGLAQVPSVGSLPADRGLTIIGHFITGDNWTGENMGQVVSKLGDFNHDGFGDVLIASHRNDKAYVIFGGPSSSFTNGTLNLSTIDGGDSGSGPVDNRYGFQIGMKPLSQDTWFGYAMEGVDINNDGNADIVISDRTAKNTTGSAGDALIIYGAPNMNASTIGWKNIEVKESGGNAFFLPQGNVQYSVIFGDARNYVNGVKNANIGDNITNVGDVNGDGVDDILVTDASGNGQTQGNPLATGGATAYLFYGKSSGFPINFDVKDFKNGVDGVRIHSMLDDTLGTGEWTSHRFGTSLGDINGDGVDDFALGSPFNLGRVWVIYGKQGGYAARDINLDVGAPAGKDYFPRDPGHVTTFTAADGFVILNSASTTATPVGSAERFGFSVRSAGDLNTDGISDFVIGAPYKNSTAGTQTGALYVVFGTGVALTSPVQAINDIIANPSRGYVLYGEKPGEQIGTTVAVGDWNGDGLADIGTGSYGADLSGKNPNGTTYGGTDSGALYIYYSKADFTQQYTVRDDDLTANLNGGGVGFDLLLGGGGNDTIRNIATNDYANGGAGSDVIRISSLDFKAVDGATGVDTLVLDGRNMSLDLSTLKTRITGFEKFDLGANGNNSATITLNDVQRLGATNLLIEDGKQQMAIVGDSSDRVTLRQTSGTGWTDAGHQIIGGVSYHLFTVAGSEVLIDDRIQSTVA